MNTIQEEMTKVLDKERELNNLINAPVKRGVKPPKEVMQAKVDYYNKLRRDGKSQIEAAKAIGIHWTTVYEWMRILKGLAPKSAHRVRKTKKAEQPVKAAEADLGLTKLGKPRKRAYKTRHKPYSYDQRRELVLTAREMVGAGQVKTITDAAKVMGVPPGTLCTWNSRYSFHRRKSPKRPAVKTWAPVTSLPPLMAPKLGPALPVSRIVAALVREDIVKPSFAEHVENVLLKECLRG